LKDIGDRELDRDSARGVELFQRAALGGGEAFRAAHFLAACFLAEGFCKRCLRLEVAMRANHRRKRAQRLRWKPEGTRPSLFAPVYSH
jgi:hypothetical protein